MLLNGSIGNTLGENILHSQQIPLEALFAIKKCFHLYYD